MKKILLLTACFVALVATAQEKQRGLMIEGAMGFAKYGNYSALSAFTDPTETYQMITSESLTVGYRVANLSSAFTFLLDDGTTSQLNMDEHFSNLGFLADFRIYHPLSSRLELMTGVTGGLLLHYNRFVTPIEGAFTTHRLGYMGTFLLGLNYKISPNHHIGLKWHPVQLGSYLGKAPELPTSVSGIGNIQTSLTASCFMVCYGVQF